MKIYLKTGRVCKTSKHFIKVEVPKLFNKYTPSWKGLITAYNNVRLQELPLQKMMKLK